MLRGPTRSGGPPGTLLIAGTEHQVAYLTGRFFEGEPRREKIGTVPLWNLVRTLQRLRTSADLTIAHVDRISARRWFDEDYLAVPEWIGSILAVLEEPDNLARRSRNLSRELQVACRNGLRPEVSYAEADFERFYHTMYAPFIRNRHGEQAVIRNVYWMRRIFRRGGLIWMRHNGRPIAGVLFQRQNQVLGLAVFGTVDGDWAPVDMGAFVGLYFFSVKYARELHCTLIDLDGCRPSLADGPLRHKRKWGISLIEKQDTWYDFQVHWNSLNDVVAHFLAHTPLIFRNHDGLSAIHAIHQEEPVSDIDVRKAHRILWVPGLRRFYLTAVSGWRTGRQVPPQTVLLNPTTPGDVHPRMLRSLWNR